MKVAAETLSVIAIFKQLDIADRQRLAEKMTVRPYAPRQQVIAQDDASSDVFFVVSGRVRATVYASTGKEVSYEDLGPGDMFGEMAAIDGHPRSTHVVALVDSLVACMPRDLFWSAVFSYPSVTERLLKRLTGMVRMHCERIFEYGTMDVSHRVRAELLRLARATSKLDGEVAIPDAPTHAEIASRVATHREAVTRECKQLEAMGLIEWRPGRHVIKDVGKLERLVRDGKGE